MRVHLIGIGGSGLSAIAQVLLESGIEVSGSDRQLSPLTQRLEAAGARVSLGHNPENIGQADLVVRSSAIPDDNPEVQAALARGIPVLKRADFLGRLTAGKQTLAVAGTHGKTTTTAMLAWLLSAIGLDPSYVIGGLSLNLMTNAHSGLGPYFVIEADEYDRMFLGLDPWIAVVTNIEHDHPDCYPTPEDFYQGFREFAGRIAENGTLVVHADDPGAMRLGQDQSHACNVITYGLEPPLLVGESRGDGFGALPDYQATNIHPNHRGGFDFIVCSNTAKQADGAEKQIGISLQAPGKHNVQNSLAAMAVADLLGLSWEKCASILGEYRGASRRFEVRGEVNGVTIIDDYAHHPTEIRATLAASRARYPGRQIWAVWQPHTYSRTRALSSEFARAFGEKDASPVDHLIITEIYAARESAPKDGFSIADVLGRIDHVDMHYIPDLPAVSDYLLDHLHSGDILLVLSAGDADQISTQVFAGLGRRGNLA